VLSQGATDKVDTITVTTRHCSLDSHASCIPSEDHFGELGIPRVCRDIEHSLMMWKCHVQVEIPWGPFHLPHSWERWKRRIHSLGECPLDGGHNTQAGSSGSTTLAQLCHSTPLPSSNSTPASSCTGSSSHCCVQGLGKQGSLTLSCGIDCQYTPR